MISDSNQFVSDTYDAVVMAGVVGHGALPYEAFEEMTRIVKPGAKPFDLCLHLNREGGGGWREHERSRKEF